MRSTVLIYNQCTLKGLKYELAGQGWLSWCLFWLEVLEKLEVLWLRVLPGKEGKEPRLRSLWPPFFDSLTCVALIQWVGLSELWVSHLLPRVPVWYFQLSRGSVWTWGDFLEQSSMFHKLKKQKLLPGDAFPPQEAPPCLFWKVPYVPGTKPPSPDLVCGETKYGKKGKRGKGVASAAGKEQDAARETNGVGGTSGRSLSEFQGPAVLSCLSLRE